MEMNKWIKHKKDYPVSVFTLERGPQFPAPDWLHVSSNADIPAASNLLLAQNTLQGKKQGCEGETPHEWGAPAEVKVPWTFHTRFLK